MKKLILLGLLFFTALLSSQTFQTGTLTVTFNDPARTGGFGSGGGPGRQIQTEIYYPATVAGSNVAVASGSFPVVVIGHGFVMDWASYDNIYSELSKRGYIVALPRTEGGFSPSHSDFGLDIALVGNKVMLLNATNTITTIFVGKVSQKLALAGHSMGGGSSFLAAKNNPSVTCLFNFAAAQTNPASSQAAKQVVVPTLIIGGQADCVAPASTNQNKMWDSTASTKKFEIIIKNLTHCDFGNGANFNCTFGQNTSNCPSTVTNTTALKLYMNFVNPFLDFNLKNSCSEGTRFMDSLNLSQVIFAKQQLGVLGCSPTDIGERTWINTLNVYPNPAKEAVFIEGLTNLELKIELFSIMGQKLDVKTATEANKLKIELTDLPKGIYSVKINGNNDSVIKRIIKE
ncbi:MAG: T9SS type A sorting domain-containing protein [Bacteroidia bacterium]|nr:T9SS type A sorting domain-containing protein [Bacteroidia bacterium]